MNVTDVNVIDVCPQRTPFTTSAVACLEESVRQLAGAAMARGIPSPTARGWATSAACGSPETAAEAQLNSTWNSTELYWVTPT